MIGIQEATVHFICTPVCGLSKESDGFQTQVERNYDDEEKGYIPTCYVFPWNTIFKGYQYILGSTFYLGDIVVWRRIKTGHSSTPQRCVYWVSKGTAGHKWAGCQHQAPSVSQSRKRGLDSLSHPFKNGS